MVNSVDVCRFGVVISSMIGERLDDGMTKARSKHCIDVVEVGVCVDCVLLAVVSQIVHTSR